MGMGAGGGGGGYFNKFQESISVHSTTSVN